MDCNSLGRFSVPLLLGGQIWRHYKGKDYRIIAVSRHTEDLAWYVVYEALYDNPVSKIWHRPLEMFLSPIEADGAVTQRFRKIEADDC